MVAFVEPLADYDPRQVGGFRLQARLGAGGMGRVFLGYSPGGRPVAVKVVPPDLARDPEFMQRFRREVTAAQSVSDAYTAAVVGAGPDDSPPWVATTFVAGPRVIDFGISRTTEGTVVTATHTTIGTPAYMSPEQAQGHPVGPSSDVFSLGSVLAFAATGAAPFGSGGTEIFAIAYRVVNGEPDLSRVPASLRPLIDACLAKDPAARPSDGQLILDV